MKKISILIILAGLVAFSACRKLDVDVESQYVTSNFPQTLRDYQALMGTMYSNLSSSYAVTYWRMQELSTDEAILPARQGNFDDGGQYRLMHYHTWTFDHPYVNGIWQWGFGGGITNCNRLLDIVSASKLDEATKASFILEIRAMRALYYYFMMDTYGNVPIMTKYQLDSLPTTQPRAEVFKFIESELKDLAPKLPSKNGTDNTLQYGRPTKGMCYALLCKMYLNSQVYTGVARNTETVAMADSVQANPNYSLDARYRDIFLPNNGPQIQETIFAVPYDQQIGGNQFTRFGFYYYMVQAYGFSVGLSIAMSTTPEFYDRFNLPGDLRTQTWLVGKQFYPDGNGGFTNRPIFYPDSPNVQIEIYKDLVLENGNTMDLGNTRRAQASGVRSIKYYPDPTTTAATRVNGNDVPVLRLADVLLMKAEAITRGATATTVNGVLQTADYLVNLVRQRAGVTQTVSGIKTAQLLDERARELFWEGWRRNDLIRYDLFEQDYPLPNETIHMDKSPYRRLFPIPINEIRLNTNLKQNPGYPQ